MQTELILPRGYDRKRRLRCAPMMSPRLGLGLGGGRTVPASGIVPPTPPAGAAMWLRADKIALGAVASWTDASGNGHAPVQATGLNQPTNTANAGPGGTLPAVVFASVNGQNLAPPSALISTKNYTVAVVGKVNATNTAMSFVSFGGSNSNGLFVGVNQAATSRRDFFANGVTANSDTTSLATTAWEAWIFSSDAAGNLSLTVNGTAHTLSVTSATLLAPSATLDLGSVGAAKFLNGALFEVLVWTTALSAPNLAATAAYQLAVTGL